MPPATDTDNSFHFTLTDEEKHYLKDLVRLSILRGLKKRVPELPAPPTERLRQPFGAFVTLKLQGRLRGCIGHIVGDAPLFETVASMAQAAAFDDPRFSRLELAEFERLEIEISILSPLERCPDPERIEIGRHGLLIRKDFHSGLLLPQVPVEWRWDQTTFLQQTCRKAGLPPNAWKDLDTELYWFEAEVF